MICVYVSCADDMCEPLWIGYVFVCCMCTYLNAFV